MGRTIPSITQTVYMMIAQLKPLYGALPRSDQRILDQFFEDVLQQRVPIGHTASLLPMSVLPFVILLEERKRLDRVHAELKAYLEELDKTLDQLSPPT